MRQGRTTVDEKEYNSPKGTATANAHVFSLQEESSLIGAKMSKALPYLEAKAVMGQ